MRQYNSWSRRYPAQIFNRVIFRNANSHRTDVGRFRIQTIYSNGSRPDTYAGNYSDILGETNNAIGTEVVSRYNDSVALRVYVDGRGVYRPYLFDFLGYHIFNEIDEMIREAFDFVNTIYDNDDDLFRVLPTHHIRRKLICTEFKTTYDSTDDFSTFLEQKYNQGVENAETNV